MRLGPRQQMILVELAKRPLTVVEAGRLVHEARHCKECTLAHDCAYVPLDGYEVLTSLRRHKLARPIAKSLDNWELTTAGSRADPGYDPAQTEIPF